MKKNRIRRYQRGSLLQKKGRWVAKWYYAPGKQTTRVLGLVDRLVERQARIMLDELVRSLNLNPEQARRFETVERFVQGVFIPVKVETGQWRHNTADRATGEIKNHILSEIGSVSFDELRPNHLRSVLKKMAVAGFSKSMVSHIQWHLVDLCTMAVAEGYLPTNISDGLALPKIKREATEKRVVSLADYAAAWEVLNERERLLCDLVLLAGMRPSEAFGLWCGDVLPDRIYIHRSWCRGRYEEPKTPRSKREIGPPEELLSRLHGWLDGLPNRGPEAPVFPSLSMVTPVSDINVLRRYLYPKLDAVGLGRFSFDVLRRTHSTLHKQLKTDPKVVAAQQGHGLNTHLEEYVQVDVSEKRAESAKLYAKFLEALKNQKNRG